jgi:tRNA 2-thiouridine synthesizing protein A
MTWDAELDARGLLCPLPVLKARKRLAALPSGAVLRLLADDPAAVIDVPHFCAGAGHALVASEEIDGGCRAFLIRAGGADQASRKSASP